MRFNRFFSGKVGFLTILGLFFPNIVLSQTNLPFDATFQNTATSTIILSNFPFTISRSEIQGISQDAPYGLTQISGKTYSQVNVLTGELSFNTDPSVYGLLNFPQGFIAFSALDGSQLIGSDSATGFIDFTTLIATASGTFTITQGVGRFQGATGTFGFSEIDQLSLDPTVPLIGIAQTSGFFQIPTVSEPNAIPALLLLGIFFLKR